VASNTVVGSKRKFTSGWSKEGRSGPSSPDKKRKTAVGWSEEEEIRVVKGVRECGQSEWAAIRRKYFDGQLPERSGVDIKDKWRGIQKNKTLFAKLERKSHSK